MIRILIVEDEAIVALDISQKLEQLGYTVSGTAADFDEALQKAGETLPDMVLMDIHLRGDRDGIDAAQSILNNFNIPVVFLTAYSDAETLRKAADSGAYAYIKKPYTDAEIIWNLELASRVHTLKRQLQESETQYRNLFNNTVVGVFQATPEGVFTSANQTLAEMMGYEEVTDIIATGESANNSILADPEQWQNCISLIKENGIINNCEIELIQQSGEHILVSITARGIIENDEIICIDGIMRDITEEMKMVKRINHLAFYDDITGLPNRNLFIDRLGQAVARVEHSGRNAAVLIIDIDRFKTLNDVYGVATGDELLRIMGKRLKDLTRDGDTVARIGSDDFGILLVDMAEPDDVISLVEKIRNSISEPIEINSSKIVMTASIGIAVCPVDGTSAHTLLQNTDMAVMSAKKEGYNSYKFYKAAMNSKAEEYLKLEHMMYDALKKEEFLPYYQPYYHIQSAKMAGMESLLRWQNDELGLVSPGRFIPILEDTGLIVDVGEWLIRKVSEDIIKWQGKNYNCVPVAINLSQVQFRQKKLMTALRKTIKKTGVSPSLLKFEITESTFALDIEYTSRVLQEMRDLGITISIDDFGTGYSSLGYLKRMPLDFLKIDISFIRDISTNEESESIVRAIISMAHSLNLKTIAEGVETREQLDKLATLGSDIAQGYLLSRPLPEAELVELLKK